LQCLRRTQSPVSTDSSASTSVPHPCFLFCVFTPAFTKTLFTSRLKKRDFALHCSCTTDGISEFTSTGSSLSLQKGKSKGLHHVRTLWGCRCHQKCDVEAHSPHPAVLMRKFAFMREVSQRHQPCREERGVGVSCEHAGGRL
jgi:hypothetical protein